MGTASPAVVDVFRCIDSIKKRRNEAGSKGLGCTPSSEERRRGKQRSKAAADKALRESYYEVLQRKNGRLPLSERIKTLRRMVLAQGLPADSEQKRPKQQGEAGPESGSSHRSPAKHVGRVGGRGGSACNAGNSGGGGGGVADPAEDRCSLRGLVWKVLLGTIHTDAVLYVRLVGKGPSSEDVKIREDTFRTFHGDEEFRRRVHEDKLSRINNAFVRLHSPDGAAMRRRGSGDRGDYGGGGGSGGDGGSSGGISGEQEWDNVGDSNSGGAGGGAGAGTGALGRNSNSASKSGGRGGGGGGGGAGGAAGSGGKGLYVQGMMVLCAPLLFVMPEVDAFFCFNALLSQHMPRYVAANLDGVHAGCALVDRVLSVVDPVLFNYLESKFLTANIYAFPLVMSLHACVPPLEEAVKLWDAVFSFGVHLEVLVCVAQCVSLRDILLQDPNPYQHLNARNLPPLDAELLVSMAFSLIPHLSAEMMDEIAQHPFAEERVTVREKPEAAIAVDDGER